MANTGDNYGTVLEALNDKMDRDVENRSTGVETIVETWHNGTEWYRIWSDGWIEQGGMTALGSATSGTVTFNKVFSDTNYVFSCICQSVPVNITYGPIAKAKTASTIGLYGGSQLQNVYWMACGY